jgi:hypothetical protein
VGPPNARSGIRRLELSAAARYEHYSDFGGQIKPKFGLTWNPADWLLIRGSYAEGFLAPSLAQLGQADIYRTMLAEPTATASGHRRHLCGRLRRQHPRVARRRHQPRSRVSPLRWLRLCAA